MKLLGDMGAIHRHAFEGGPSRFEHASGDHHDHLIDIETGDVIEFKSDRIEQLQNEIAKSLGYDIVHHRLELYGRKRRAADGRCQGAGIVGRRVDEASGGASNIAAQGLVQGSAEADA